MSLGGLLLLALVSTASRPDAALVFVGAPSDAERDSARNRASRSFKLVDDPALRAVLEGTQPPPPAAERVRADLERARERLRRFELPKVGAALRSAAEASEELGAEEAPLAVEVAIAEAQLAIVQNDERRQLEALALALSCDPNLQLDPGQYPPNLIDALARARELRAARPRRPLRVQAAPPEASVSFEGLTLGSGSVVLEAPEGLPLRVCASLSGWTSGCRRVPAGWKLGAAVTVELSRAPSGELVALVEAVRAADDRGRPSAALALAKALDLDAVLVAGPPDSSLAVYRRSSALATAPQSPAANTSAPASTSGFRRWAPWAATALAAVLAGAGTYFGFAARADAEAADHAEFAGDGARQSERAHDKALAANLLFGGAGASALGAVVLFTF